MKTITFKIIVFLFIIPFIGFANNNRGKYKKTKEVSKTYNVSNNNTLNIKNKYGNVDIVTWDKNSIEINVNITVSGNDEDKIIERLDKIQIEFDQQANQVFATTKINKNKSKSWSFNFFGWSSSSNTNLQIDYTIKMPVNNNLTVFNDYGSILLDKLNGKANINCDYGKIIIGSLNNQENEINIDYTNHSVIDFIENGTIVADYSSFTVEKANLIKLNADYTTSKFQQVKSLNYTCDFGTLRVEKTNHIVGNGDYLSLNIGTINNNAKITSSFGSLKIDSLQKGFDNVTINADYTSIKIGIASDASCNFETNVSYGSLSHTGDLFTINKKREKSNSKEYIGYFNTSNTNSTIFASTEFGSIKLYQN